MTTTDRVRQYLRSADLSRAKLYIFADRVGSTVDIVAKALKREGVTYTELVDQERRRRLLSATPRRAKDIARHLGYVDSETLYRACRRWYGRGYSEVVRWR